MGFNGTRQPGAHHGDGLGTLLSNPTPGAPNLLTGKRSSYTCSHMEH